MKKMLFILVFVLFIVGCTPEKETQTSDDIIYTPTPPVINFNEMPKHIGNLSCHNSEFNFEKEHWEFFNENSFDVFLIRKYNNAKNTTANLCLKYIGTVNETECIGDESFLKSLGYENMWDCDHNLNYHFKSITIIGNDLIKKHCNLIGLVYEAEWDGDFVTTQRVVDELEECLNE